MSGLRHVDWVGSGYDVAFLDNAFTVDYHWHDAAAGATESDSQALAALRSLGQIWAPTRCLGTLRRADGARAESEAVEYAAGDVDPGAAARTIAAAIENTLASDRRLIATIGPAVEGWTRIAVPRGADAAEPWTLVSDEGIIAADAAVRRGEAVGGLDTVWLRMPGGHASSDLSVFADALGEAEARLTLGATFYAPGAEPRSPALVVRGVALAEWQAAAARLLAAAEAELTATGWRRGGV